MIASQSGGALTLRYPQAIPLTVDYKLMLTVVKAIQHEFSAAMQVLVTVHTLLPVQRASITQYHKPRSMPVTHSITKQASDVQEACMLLYHLLHTLQVYCMAGKGQ